MSILEVFYTNGTKFDQINFNGTWSGGDTIKVGSSTPQSQYCPGAVQYDGSTYLIYTGKSSSDLYTSWLTNGSWNGNKKIGDQGGDISPKAYDSPNGAVFNDKMYIAYVTSNSFSSSLYTAYFDGSDWYGDTKISDQSGDISSSSAQAPAVVVFNNKLYLVYLDGSFGKMKFCWYDGNQWFGDTTIDTSDGNPETYSTPGIVVYNDKLYIFYSSKLYGDLYSAYFDGTTWYGNTKIADQPGGISPKGGMSPTASVYNNKIYLVYTGSSRKDLFSCWYDGATWYGDTKIKDQAGGVDAQSYDAPSSAVSA